MGLADIGEFGLIDALAGRLACRGRGVVLGIGDDTAVLRPQAGLDLLVTCDAQVEGVHFLRERWEPHSLGERIAAVNLSDIAAMGGQPRWALSSIVLPLDIDMAWLSMVYDGLDAGLHRHDAQVVGGNTARGESLSFDLTLIGEVERGRALPRGGARPGDLVCVTGELGAAAAGFAALSQPLVEMPALDRSSVVARHLLPTPRIAAGQSLAASGAARSCIDLSDGLAGDAGHVARASGVTLCVDLETLPVSRSTMVAAAALAAEAEAWAVCGGEDYELLFTFDASQRSWLAELSSRLELPITVIGRVEAGPPQVRWERHGKPVSLDVAGGYEHFRRQP